MFNARRSILLFLTLMCLASLAIMGCGGDSSSNNNDSGGNSKVALFLADGPADDFDHIWIEVSEISLLPEGNAAPVVIYETDNPERIDLLSLREDDLLLAVNSSVPAGAYQKIRLTVNSVEGQQADQPVDLQLSSGKIDLNPKGTIDVKPGETLSLRLDIDAEKSIHVAGPNYNFRPVVFVDAGPMQNPLPCHHLIKGEITELLYPDQDNETVVGFRMTPFGAYAALDVYLEDDVVIFDDTGQVTGPEALAVDQIVCIKGKLDTDGGFLAGTVIIGEVQTLSGVVESAVDDQNQFLVDAGYHWDDPMFKGDAMSDDGSTTVALSDGTTIQLDGVDVGADQIQPGLKTHIVGKMDEESGIMNAIAVFLKARQIIGMLTKIEADGEGSRLTIKTAMGAPHDAEPNEEPASQATKEACHGEEEIIVFLPDAAPLSVKGGAELTLAELTALVACEAPRVQVQIDSGSEKDSMAQAAALVVWPQFVKLAVASVDLENRIITAASGATLQVPENTPIWLCTLDEQEPMELGDIEAGDVLLVAALKICEPADYSAVVIVKMPGCEPPDDDHCLPHHKRIELTVAELGDNTITGEKETSVAVTGETVYIDMTQRPPQEMEFGDIAVGDALVCHILKGCDDQPDRALLVFKVDPEGGQEDLPPGGCIPKITHMEAVVETVAEAAIQTTAGQTIQVPSGTPIYERSENGFEALTLEDLAPDDALNILAMRSCHEDGVTALMIIRQAD
jgi:hypothetical protein